MTLVSAALVAAIVLAIGAIRSIRWRAFVYALPVPITLALLTAVPRVDGSQLIGVVLLNGFIIVVACLHTRTRWHILIADAGGVAVYLGLAWLVASLAPIPFLPVLGAVCFLWLLTTLIIQPSGASSTTQTPPPQQLAKVGTVVGASLLVVAAGRLINGLAVTFPYAGVLVVIETRDHLDEFARYFARNSIALVAFFTGYWALQEHHLLYALGGAWLSFATATTTLNLAERFAGRTQRQRDPST